MQIRRLLLVRHGLAVAAPEDPSGASPGPSLSEVGRAQAGAAAAVLTLHAPVALYSSPLARAHETALEIGRALELPVQVAPDLGERRETERLHEVTIRSTRWLVHWLDGTDACAVVVSHACPLLELLRAALFMPQVGWRGAEPDALRLAGGGRFEVAPASVFELAFEPRSVVARCLHRSTTPSPSTASVSSAEGAAAGSGHDNGVVCRPNFLHLLGCRMRA